MASVNVTVDDDFARFGGKSYAINKINSIEVRKRQPHGAGAAFLFGLLTIVMLGVAVEEQTGKAWGFCFAALCGVATYWAWRRSQIVEYQLFLMTSSSETQAFVSRDADQVLGLRDRIEQAMTKRP